MPRLLHKWGSSASIHRTLPDFHCASPHRILAVIVFVYPVLYFSCPPLLRFSGPVSVGDLVRQCCWSGMFIPDPNFSIPDPGSENFGSRIRIKESNYFKPKKLCLSSRKHDPRCSFRIRILIFYPSRILEQAQNVTGTRILDPGSCSGYPVFSWKHPVMLTTWAFGCWIRIILANQNWSDFWLFQYFFLDRWLFKFMTLGPFFV